MQGTDGLDRYVGEADDVSGRLVLKRRGRRCMVVTMHPPLSDGKVGERVTLRGRVSLSFWDRGGEQRKDSSSCLRAL